MNHLKWVRNGISAYFLDFLSLFKKTPLDCLSLWRLCLVLLLHARLLFSSLLICNSWMILKLFHWFSNLFFFPRYLKVTLLMRFLWRILVPWELTSVLVFCINLSALAGFCKDAHLTKVHSWTTIHRFFVGTDEIAIQERGRKSCGKNKYNKIV